MRVDMDSPLAKQLLLATVSYLLFVFIVIIVMGTSGCSIITYTGNPDGTTVVKSYVLGTNSTLEKFNGSMDNGTIKRKISFNGLDANQTQGMEQLNQFVKSIVEGAVKGAK